MASVLVTGASGFIGGYAAKALAESGWGVVGTGRSEPDSNWLHRWIVADLLQPADVHKLVHEAGADVLLHLAWCDDTATRWHSLDNLAWAAASLQLVKKFAEAGGRKVVFGSSCAVYDFSARLMHAESDYLVPDTLYGAAKASTASLIVAAQAAMRLCTVEARIFFCFGAGERSPRLVPDLIAGLSKGESVPCTNGLQKRDYLHASDVGRALQLLVSNEVSGPVNVASGVSISIAEIIKEISTQLGCPDLPNLGALKRSSNDPIDISADVARLKSLGFQPAHTLSSGVAATLAKYGNVR